MSTEGRVAVLLSLLALGGSMVLAVKRAGDVRRTAVEVESLRRDLNEARENVSRAERRMDSLSARRRVVRAAEEMGLHIPADSEVHLLPELPAPESVREDAR